MCWTILSALCGHSLKCTTEIICLYYIYYHHPPSRPPAASTSSTSVVLSPPSHPLLQICAFTFASSPSLRLALVAWSCSTAVYRACRSSCGISCELLPSIEEFIPYRMSADLVRVTSYGKTADDHTWAYYTSSTSHTNWRIRCVWCHVICTCGRRSHFHVCRMYKNKLFAMLKIPWQNPSGVGKQGSWQVASIILVKRSLVDEAWHPPSQNCRDMS